MSHSQPFSKSYYSNHEKADDSSTVFDADTVVPDEVPSLPPASQEESPQSFTSVLLRRINSQHRPAEPSTTTATAKAKRSEGISRSNQHQCSSSSSTKRPITNSSVKRKQLQENSTSKTTKKSSTKRPRRSSRLKRQPDQICTDDKSDSEVMDENGLEDYEPAVINQSSSSSQTSTTKLTKFELKWKNKFEELRAYKRSNGHVNVPQRNKELGEWVSTQRKEYRKFKKNKKSSITSRRIEMLESIGFEWVSPNKGGGSRNESKWNEHFNELKAYKEEYKDTNVPHRWEDNKELGKWVSNQRTEYKKFEKNEKSQITSERIDLLNSIGFEWVSPRNESVWNERFNELNEYKKNNGHTNVPQNFEDNKQLGVWVSTQRTEYKKFKENKHSCMTDERIKTLESIDFEWVPNKGGRFQRNESKWNKRFNELKEYKEEYKDTNVPQRSKDNKQLGLWVSNQRTQYKKFQENKKSQITPERIDLLNSIGFQWECCPARASRS